MITVMIWIYSKDSLPPEAIRKHLLWGLMVLKVYATQAVNGALPGYTEKSLSDGRGTSSMHC